MARPPLPIGERGNIKRTQLADGSWQALCRYRDADGQTRRVKAVGRSGQKAENALLAALKRRQRRGAGTVTPETTVKALSEVWFPTVKKSPGTRDTYRQQLDVHILPRLHKVRLREISTGSVEAFLSAVAAGQTKTITSRGGKTRVTRIGGPGAAKSCRTVLALMLSMAVRYDAIPANPVRETTTPAGPRTPARALTVEGFRQLRANVVSWQDAGRLGPCRSQDLVDKVDMMIATGARPGEVLAFRWADVRLDVMPPTVEVSGTVRRTSERGLHRQEYPKSVAGGRVIALPAFAVKMLAARKLAQDPESNPAGLVFPSLTGGVIEPGNLRRQWVAARGEEYGWVKPSSFRKTVATLIEREVDSLVASKQLGHTSDRVTLAHYIERDRVVPDSTAILERFTEL